MKIVITTVQALFVKGGAEFLADNLVCALKQAGHQVELVKIPFMDRPCEKIEEQIITARLMEVASTWTGQTDLCIGLKFPAYFIPHPNKVIWMLHQHRDAYELFDTSYSNLKNNDIGNEARTIIYNADNRYLPEAKRIYTISEHVSQRLEKYNGIGSVPLYHPCPDMDRFFCKGYEDYILVPSRITQAKRQMLALEALAKTRSNVKLYILGKADHPAEMKKLTDFVEEQHLGERVRFLDYVSQEEKFRLYAKAKAILFVPKEEDYGYITLEAMAASKPVITATDSGGPLEFVEHDKTGMVMQPEAEELARAMDEIWSSNTMAETYGRQAKKKLEEMDVSWNRVVKELVRT